MLRTIQKIAESNAAYYSQQSEDAGSDILNSMLTKIKEARYKMPPMPLFSARIQMGLQ
jgi:hypothetical protein